MGQPPMSCRGSAYKCGWHRVNGAYTNLLQRNGILRHQLLTVQKRKAWDNKETASLLCSRHAGAE